VISLKKFLSQNPETDQALLNAVSLLVEGIGQHAVEGGAADGVRFREGMKALSDALGEDSTPAEIVEHAQLAISKLEEHNRRAGMYHRLQHAELQNMVKMLAATVGAVTAAGNSNLQTLGEIENQVAKASELDDVRTIKSKLADCLMEIRKEAERQQKATGETITRLSQGLEKARQQALGVTGAIQDNITGLPLRQEAEAVLAQAGHSTSQAFAAVMVLDRLPHLNVRFGREVGDEVLVAYTRMLQKQLSREDRLFRWGGPALLAVLPRRDTLEQVRREFGRLMENKLEHSIQTSSRSTLVLIGARWTLIPMMAAPRLMYQKIDAFAAIPSAQG
jgi:diguanylate cyclase (GGDEF)-like protein